jgi:hypothetical protein
MKKPVGCASSAPSLRAVSPQNAPRFSRRAHCCLTHRGEKRDHQNSNKYGGEQREE